MAKIYFLLEDKNLQKEFESLTEEYAKATMTAELESHFVQDIPSITHYLKEQPPVEEGKDPEIRIVYFQISQQRKNWIEQIEKLKSISPKTAFVILKYEDAGISKLDLLKPAFDDLIYLPVDRSIFLQKMQILMTLPKKATPTFLFHIEKPMDIEVSKLTKLSRFNDCIWWMDNPIPLQNGLPSHFYLTIPPHGPVLNVHAKAIASLRHPKYMDRFLVAFALMGPHREELTQMRVQMQQTFKAPLLIDENTKPDLSALHIGIIDHEQTVRDRVHELINQEIPGTLFTIESSLALLAQETPIKINWDDVTGTTTEDFPKVPFEFLIHKESKDFRSFKTNISQDHSWLGYGLDEWRTGPQKWWSAFDSEQNKNLIDEALSIVNGQGHPHWHRHLLVKDSAGTTRQMNIELIMDKDEQVLVKLTPQEHVQKPKEDKPVQPLDLVIISSKFIPAENPVSWLEGIHAKTKCPNFFIMIDQNEKVKPEWLSSPHLKGVSIKPIDPRHLMALVAESLDRQDLKYSINNLGFAKADWNVHAAKPVKLISISEYGVTLELTRPLRDGTFLFLRQGIFDKAPNACLCARSYISEQRDKNIFHVSFMYYGIQDDFLKHVRSLVKELYALEKSQEGGG